MDKPPGKQKDWEQHNWAATREGLDLLQVGVSVFDNQLRLVSINRFVQELLGLPSELCKEGTGLEDVFRYNALQGEYGSGDVEEQVAERMELARKFEPHQFERHRPDGTIIEVTGAPLPSGGFITTYTDVTERNKTRDELRLANEELDRKVEERTKKLGLSEQELARKSALLEATLEYMGQGITMIDAQMVMAVCNDKFGELMEIPPELAKPGTPFEAFMRYNAERGEYGPGDVEEQVRVRVEAAKKREPHCFQRTRPDGTVIEVRGTPLPDGSFVTTYSDITERTKAEEALAKAHEDLEEKSTILETTLEHMSQGISLFDGELNALVLNRPFRELLDFPKELSHPGTPLSAFFRYNAERGEYGPGDVEEQVRERVELAKKFEAHRFQRTRTDGTVIDIVGTPLSSGGFVTTYTDITAQVEAENAIKNNEQRLLRILESSPIGVGISLLQEGRFEFCNPRLAELFSCEVDELLGSPVDHYFVNPDLSRELTKKFAQDGIVLDAEAEMRRKDGKAFWALLSLEPIHYQGEEGLLSWIYDISEMKRYEADLQSAKNWAEQANRAKSDFLSSMSHELRTPMNGILGFAQLMQFTPDEPLSPKQAEYVELIIKSGGHLLELINEVLDLSKIESGTVVFSPEPLQVEEVVRECLELVGPMADGRNIDLTMSSDLKGRDAKSAMVLADYTRFKQTLVNLLSNAVKYNRDGGKVTVHCERREPRRLRIGVEDTGHGIPAEQLSDLFQPFNRLGAENSGIEGTGIGLALTHKLIELMGGSIEVESTVGEGSVFWLDMPAVEAGGKKETPNQARTENAVALSLSPGNYAVLYIEDNPDNLRLMREWLAQFPQLTLHEATNAEIGIEMARNLNPSIVFMDINLPGMDGLAALKEIRRYDGACTYPVVAVSANAMPEDVKRGREEGFADYLTKPLDLKRVLEVINEQLAWEDYAI